LLRVNILWIGQLIMSGVAAAEPIEPVNAIVNSCLRPQDVTTETDHELLDVQMSVLKSFFFSSRIGASREVCFYPLVGLG